MHLLGSRIRLSAGVTRKSRAWMACENVGGRWPGSAQAPGHTGGIPVAPPSSSTTLLHGLLQAVVSDCTPVDGMRIFCSCAGQPEPRSVAPTSDAVRRRRTPPRITAEETSSVLAFETIAANRAKERDAIDSGSTSCFSDVAARSLEKLRDVLALEAFEQLGLCHSKGKLLQPVVGGLALQRGRDLGGVALAAQRRCHAKNHHLLEIVAQLAHVARPGVARERFEQRLIGLDVHVELAVFGDGRQQRANEQRQIGEAFTPRGNSELDYRQPLKRTSAK